MKKFLIFLLFATVIFASFGCREKIVPYKLDKPVLSVQGDYVVWEYVPSAVKYEVVTDFGTFYTTNTIWKIEEGITQIKVRCVGDGKYFLSSDFNYINITNNLEEL